MKQWGFQAKDEWDTERLAQALARRLPDRAIVALIGTLGAGKTRFVQALAQAEGVPEHLAVSPTFVLIHQYPGRRPMYHIDAYRISSQEEFWDLGPEEYFEADGITVIEWADRVLECLPPDRLEIEIEITGPHSRRFSLRAYGQRYEGLLDDLAKSTGSSS